MPRQLDERGAHQLKRTIEALGVTVHLQTSTSAVLGEHRVRGLRFSRGDRLDVDMLIVAAGIRPRDELARASGLAVARQGGILVDERLRTSDPRVSAVGECAIVHGTLFGLRAPGLQMAAVLAGGLVGDDRALSDMDLSLRLQLPSIDVASLGDPFADATTHRSVVFEDELRGVYKKLVLSDDGARLVGAILVGDVHQYDKLLGHVRSGRRFAEDPAELVLTTPAPALPAGVLSAESAHCEVCTGRLRPTSTCAGRPHAAE
jgi:nitrite reductase (NADH) large subunit